MNSISCPAPQLKATGNFFSPEAMSYGRNTTKIESFEFQEFEQLKTTDFMMDASVNSINNLATNPVACDLQEVIAYYQSQPELLRLILLSKVEEDKRRSEEAKLRAKELDMLLLQQQQQLAAVGTPDTSFVSPQSCAINNNNNTFVPNGSNNLMSTNQFVSPTTRKLSALDILMDDSDCRNRRDSALGSSFDGSANSEELDDCTFSPNPSMLSMSFPPPIHTTANTNTRHSLQPLSPAYTLLQANSLENSSISPQITQSPEQLPEQVQDRRYDNTYFPQRPRRRREMQAISKIVETREYPYIDGFFWKNNGNTIQKKTGNKSVYYKCSNSTKGCPVNKTVTWKDNGEYLIKYRGEHLIDCGKVQRIVDM
ncbi:uncharacterized protein B0P05DRAFT_541930 [Gilbertella persicaria]|uniref:uncharacterized protein n=1 Tax=Gilbertella persicaria TaxID=101096 RepID=UPI00221FC99A|nr:uncharacterized protein B0P05DRAFT_541930 [Gilbertella persicaria]KAI8078982.1 hypothetical protein B0P05DRAFT_541930 [Gilbertella persicaria]